VHCVYTTHQKIPEFQRVTFSRFRLSAHNLKIETGRWSRIPKERRTCPCDNSDRDKHPNLPKEIPDIYKEETCTTMVEYIYAILNNIELQ